MKSKIIAVDFDGTLFTDEYPNIGNPIWNVINYCKIEQEKGAIIFLWTCRNGEVLEEAVNKCKEVGLFFDYVNENTKEHRDRHDGNEGRKIYAHEYIDDKAININVFGEQLNGKNVHS